MHNMSEREREKREIESKPDRDSVRKYARKKEEVRKERETQNPQCLLSMKTIETTKMTT